MQVLFNKQIAPNQTVPIVVRSEIPDRDYLFAFFGKLIVQGDKYRILFLKS